MNKKYLVLSGIMGALLLFFLVKGFLELDVKGKREKVYVRDSYLTYALFLAECRGII